MRHLALAALVLSLALTGCASQHEPAAPIVVPPPAADCLRADGHLSTILSIDNNDRTAHGGIVSTALADTGRLVVGSSDGALKTWTIDGAFLGLPESGAAALTYGPESPPGSTPAMDLAFDTDAHTVWAVDPSGYLAGWDTDAFGTAPRAFMASTEDGTLLGTPGAAVAVGGGIVLAAFLTGDSNNVAWMPTDTRGTALATLRFSYMDAVRDIVFTGTSFVVVGRAFGSAATNRFALTGDPAAPLSLRYSITIPGI